MDKLIELLNEWGIWGLAITAFTESSFFLIPPDTLLIPMSIANPDKALFYALLTTVLSVMGAFVGYAIGKFLGKPILKRIVKDSTIQKAEEMFDKHGALSLAFAGFTPVPFKVFTALAGAMKMKLLPFVFGSLIGRGARFLLEAFIIIYFGEAALNILATYTVPVTLGLGLLAILGAYGFVKMQKKKKHALV